MKRSSSKKLGSFGSSPRIFRSSAVVGTFQNGLGFLDISLRNRRGTVSCDIGAKDGPSEQIADSCGNWGTALYNKVPNKDESGRVEMD